MRIILYVIGTWFAVGALGLAGVALSITHRRQQALMFSIALFAATLAAIEILAAGMIR